MDIGTFFGVEENNQMGHAHCCGRRDARPAKTRQEVRRQLKPLVNSLFNSHLNSRIVLLDHHYKLGKNSHNASSPTTDMSLSTTIPFPPVSYEEAHLYYRGLPSNPLLIARTRTDSIPWEAPTSWSRPKDLRIVGEHKIQDIWEDDLATKIHAILHTKEVDWSSTDVVRIGYVDEPERRGDFIIWIGCKKLLLDRGIHDVEVEIRQSEVLRLGGPQLLEPVFDFDPTVDAREPFTPTLGITICAQSTPWAEGTAGFFLDEGGDGKRLLLATTRHVVLPSTDNHIFEHNPESQRRHDVLILSDASFKHHLAAIDHQIKRQDINADDHRRRIETREGKGDDESIKQDRHAERDLEEAKEKAESFAAFSTELSTHWATEDSRILGHVVFSPPIAVGTSPNQYTQDIAIIDVDTSKINLSEFQGNAIHLGTKFSVGELSLMMYPNAKNTHNFEYPIGRLLHLQGIIENYEMRKPTMYDQNDERCIMVIKRGRSTGLTVGRANNLFSYTRRFLGGKCLGISKEWAILPFDQKSRSFSDLGDSGSVVVDGAGRIGGLINGGCGSVYGIDITYVTPISFVLDTIRSNESFFNAQPKSRP
ncbi:hypothetical protein BDN72DRAFT_964022 [Pluteus cervinus]|uniref:Uncharacterized protein n=1 Tax=Pluteus cervinus TaxID=181527 RepID=A0ACD3AC50_9AGAR|nr:hypothetical protein BDN72DRAFT_964022 [Pluteus cervinus]